MAPLPSKSVYMEGQEPFIDKPHGFPTEINTLKTSQTKSMVPERFHFGIFSSFHSNWKTHLWELWERKVMPPCVQHWDMDLKHLPGLKDNLTTINRSMNKERNWFAVLSEKPVFQTTPFLLALIFYTLITPIYHLEMWKLCKVKDLQWDLGRRYTHPVGPRSIICVLFSFFHRSGLFHHKFHHLTDNDSKLRKVQSVKSLHAFRSI